MSNVTPITAARRWAACTVQAQAMLAGYIKNLAATENLSKAEATRLFRKYRQFAGSMPMTQIERDILREIDGERV